MSSRFNKSSVINPILQRRNLYLLALLVLLAKILLIFSIKNGGWLGADGESYLTGANGILADGIFSKNGALLYWPAGYSIVMWLLALISISKLGILISIFQSIIYCAGSMFFVEKIRQSRLQKMALPTALILGFNPTLSLSSLVIGYESLVASSLLLSISLIIHAQQKPEKKILLLCLFLVALLQGFAAFMQPRSLLFGVVLLILWGVQQGTRKSFTKLVILGICILAVLPISLVARNIRANDVATVSTNLGITMNLGAGNSATGGYDGGGGVDCKAGQGAKTVTDNQEVLCVLTWYLHHPIKSAELAINKSVFFWSPWTGPLANGTMGRNPWAKISPMGRMGVSAQGQALGYGLFGKIISWLWLSAGLLLFFLGFIGLWGAGGAERFIGSLAATPVLLAWLTSIGTIGDHRFRLPTMPLSLFLQVVGVFALQDILRKRRRGSALEPNGEAR